MVSYFSARAAESRPALEIFLEGAWTVAALAEIDEGLSEEKFRDARQVILDGAKLKALDTSAAWYLYALAEKLKARGVAVEMRNFRDNPEQIYERVAGLPHAREEPQRKYGAFVSALVALGRQAAAIWQDTTRATAFLGEFAEGFLRRLAHPKHLRARSIVFHVNEAGLRAVPIIILMGFSLAFVTAYQGAYQLQQFDATIFTIDLVALSTLRELAVLLVAIMLAGRSGSSFAAQLGTMKLNEEVEALRTMGVSPFEVLVMPRLIALLIALPLLTVIADAAGILGGYAYMSAFLDYSWSQYFARLEQAAETKHLYIGLVKTPFFAILIGIVGCMQGLSAGPSAEEVGRRTITAVVQSIFLVILADALFSVIFTKMGL